MKEKLTLSIERRTKEHAKKIAYRKGISISQLVENFLNTLEEAGNHPEIPEESITSQLAGSISVPVDVDYDKALAEILEKNYNG